MELDEKEIEQREKLKKEQGYWVCPTCKTKYYFGVLCDTCMEQEFINKINKL